MRAPTAKAPKAGPRAYELFDEGPERDAFLLVYGHAYNLLQHDDVDARHAAMHFFYDAADEDRLTFQDAIEVIGGGTTVRGDVIRLRFMYEFWLRWYKPPVMGFEASPVPDFIEAKACMVGGIEAGILAGEIWYLRARGTSVGNVTWHGSHQPEPTLQQSRRAEMWKETE